LILPGSKNTISDLLWLDRNDMKAAIERHVVKKKPLFGICGGFQMLGRTVRDPFRTESHMEVVEGLGILDVETVLHREKVTRQAIARLHSNNGSNENQFAGYEIHLGETTLGESVRPLFRLQRLGEAGWQDDGAIGDGGTVMGTYLHGMFDSADGLKWLLSHWRRLCGKSETTINVCDPATERELRYDALSDHFRRHMKLDLIYRALNL
jgi:adenosylcobyric acid synthase